MRAERRREIERQMAQQKETKKGNGLFGALAVIYLLTGGVFLYFLFKLNMLPAGYFFISNGVEQFYGTGICSYVWTSTDYNGMDAYDADFIDTHNTFMSSRVKRNYHPVRCVKDTAPADHN